MKPFKLTVFTEPVSANGFIPRIKSFLRPLKFFLQGKKIPPKIKYGGHHAVTRSLVEGLQKTGADFNYNPMSEKDIAENVMVLAGVQRLKEAIELKNNGKIKKLFAGPNICESPNEENGIVADNAIDVCIVNSEWTVKAFLAERGELQDRIDIWYAGVDTDYWKPSSQGKNEDAVVYWKSGDETLCKAVEDIIRNCNYNPVRITYGNYTVEQYKEALDKATFAVFISKRESQGIALTEAWSMNVPTYVWDIKEVICKNQKFIETTASPYLTAETGLKWNTLSELKDIIEQTRKKAFSFEPRNHTLQLFSDERSASDLINKFRAFGHI